MGLSVEVHHNFGPNDDKIYVGVTAISFNGSESTVTLTGAGTNNFGGSATVNMEMSHSMLITHPQIYTPGTTASDRPPED